tara:strand:+ start:970 stop:1983 length:1014 start_codon:yes stop_codon:yes gene_type:complete
MDEKWDSLVLKFRKLGGIADNVCQKNGEFGRGIFSIDPNIRSRIFIPSKLMVAKDDIYLEGNQLRIKKEAEYSAEVRDFFNYYQDNFSWGGGGKEIVESFEKGLSLFSSNLKKLLRECMVVDIQKRHRGLWEEVILGEFLRARAFRFNKLLMICPILELVNHDVISLPFNKYLDGISTPNYPPIKGEIIHNYNSKSPLNRFFYQGFFCKESIVFSFPFSLNLKSLGINFVCLGNQLQDDAMKIEKFPNKICVKGLPIAAVNNPRLPSAYFDELRRNINQLNFPENILIEIIDINISIRKKISEESKSVNNEVSNMLSKVINYEMNLISSCDYNNIHQ